MFQKCILWVLTIAWALLIFSFSAQPATESSELSENVTFSIVKMLPGVRSMPPEQQEKIVKMMHNTVRKIAHFTIYAVLGLFVYFLCSCYELSFGRAFCYSVIACGLYAVSDELHQLFSVGRGCRVFDMILDTVGATVGVLFARLMQRSVKRLMQRKHS